MHLQSTRRQSFHSRRLNNGIDHVKRDGSKCAVALFLDMEWVKVVNHPILEVNQQLVSTPL